VRDVVRQLVFEADSVDLARDGQGGDHRHRHDAVARDSGKRARDLNGHSLPDSVSRKPPRTTRYSLPPTRARRSWAPMAG
jgi:hypothetical protein